MNVTKFLCLGGDKDLPWGDTSKANRYNGVISFLLEIWQDVGNNKWRVWLLSSDIFVIHGVWYGAYLMRSGSGYRGEQVRPDVADNNDLYSF